MIQQGELYIRPMCHDDLPYMIEWHSDEEVMSYYEGKVFSAEKVCEKYLPRIEGKHYVHSLIIEYASKPIGYMQYYPIQLQKATDYQMNQLDRMGGIDQFIGDKSLWSKGIGTKIIQLLTTHLKSLGYAEIFLEVKATNRRAIRAYEKCGFIERLRLTDQLIVMNKQL